VHGQFFGKLEGKVIVTVFVALLGHVLFEFEHDLVAVRRADACLKVDAFTDLVSFVEEEFLLGKVLVASLAAATVLWIKNELTPHCLGFGHVVDVFLAAGARV